MKINRFDLRNNSILHNLPFHTHSERDWTEIIYIPSWCRLCYENTQFTQFAEHHSTFSCHSNQFSFIWIFDIVRGIITRFRNCRKIYPAHNWVGIVATYGRDGRFRHMRWCETRKRCPILAPPMLLSPIQQCRQHSKMRVLCCWRNAKKKRNKGDASWLEMSCNDDPKDGN